MLVGLAGIVGLAYQLFGIIIGQAFGLLAWSRHRAIAVDHHHRSWPFLSASLDAIGNDKASWPTSGASLLPLHLHGAAGEILEIFHM